LLSQVGKQWDTGRQGIRQPPFDKAQANLKDAQVTAVNPIDKMAQATGFNVIMLDPYFGKTNKLPSREGKRC